jgi:hypothetical protein
MKPLSSLKIYRSAKTPAQVITTMLVTLDKNSKRLLRGPRFSANPGSGRKIEAENVSEKTAVSACGNGLIDVIARGGRNGNVAADTRNVLNEAQQSLFPSLKSHVTVSDTLGLKAYRKVLKTALANLQA